MGADTRIQTPKTIFSRRPIDFRSATKVKENCSNGLANDYKLSAKDSSISQAYWIQLIRMHIEDHGMDIIFRRESPSGREVYMLQEWGDTDNAEVVELMRKLKQGNHGQPPCTFDIDNHRWSGKAIVSSISQDMWQIVEKEILTDKGVT